MSLLLTSLLLTACAPRSAPPVSSPTSREAPGLILSVGDKPVWPPSGPGCAELIACCDGAASVESSASLFCQLGLAAGKSCPDTQALVVAYLAEKRLPAPAACGG